MTAGIAPHKECHSVIPPKFPCVVSSHVQADEVARGRRVYSGLRDAFPTRWKLLLVLLMKSRCQSVYTAFGVRKNKTLYDFDFVQRILPEAPRIVGKT